MPARSQDKERFPFPLRLPVRSGTHLDARLRGEPSEKRRFRSRARVAVGDRLCGDVRREASGCGFGAAEARIEDQNIVHGLISAVRCRRDFGVLLRETYAGLSIGTIG